MLQQHRWLCHQTPTIVTPHPFLLRISTPLPLWHRILIPLLLFLTLSRLQQPLITAEQICSTVPLCYPLTPPTYLRPPIQAAYQPAPPPPRPSIPYAASATTSSPSSYYPAVSAPAYRPSASAPAVPMSSNSYNSYSPSAAPPYQYFTAATTTYPSTTVDSPSMYPARPV